MFLWQFLNLKYFWHPLSTKVCFCWGFPPGANVYWTFKKKKKKSHWITTNSSIWRNLQRIHNVQSDSWAVLCLLVVLSWSPEVHPVMFEKAACTTVSPCSATYCRSSCTPTAGISLMECREDYCSRLWKWSCLGTLNAANILLSPHCSG